MTETRRAPKEYGVLTVPEFTCIGLEAQTTPVSESVGYFFVEGMEHRG